MSDPEPAIFTITALLQNNWNWSQSLLYKWYGNANLNSRPFSKVPRFRLWYCNRARRTSSVSPCLSTWDGVAMSSSQAVASSSGPSFLVLNVADVLHSQTDRIVLNYNKHHAKLKLIILKQQRCQGQRVWLIKSRLYWQGFSVFDSIRMSTISPLVLINLHSRPILNFKSIPRVIVFPIGYDPNPMPHGQPSLL